MLAMRLLMLAIGILQIVLTKSPFALRPPTHLPLLRAQGLALQRLLGARVRSRKRAKRLMHSWPTKNFQECRLPLMHTLCSSKLRVSKARRSLILR
jgi:hypothetical protein